MKKVILFFICALMCAGCTLEVDHGPYSPEGPVTYTDQQTLDTSYIEVYYYDDGCWDDPYWYSEEWCDQYDDGTLCCVWYVDGWYEEWCQWDYDYCWEYNGSF